MKKRISLVLAIVMIAALFCTVVPFAVFADDTSENNYHIAVNGEDCGTNIFDAASVSEYTTIGDTVINLMDDITIDKTMQVYNNVVINGNGHTINLKEGMGNVIRVRGASITINNAVITGNPGVPNAEGKYNSSCVFQVYNDKTTVNFKDVVFNSIDLLYSIINFLGENGAVATFNLERVIATNMNGHNSNSSFIIGGNKGQQNHMIINIKDCNIAHNQCIITLNKGSTADINVENSTLALAGTAGSVLNFANPEELAEGQASKITFDATGSLLKFETGEGRTDIKKGDSADIVINYTPALPTDVTTATPPTFEVPEVTTEEVTTTDGGETTTTEKQDDETTPSATTTDGGDDKPSVTTPNATTPPPAADEGCAGCGGIAIAAQLVALICAAAVVIIKRK